MQLPLCCCVVANSVRELIWLKPDLLKCLQEAAKAAWLLGKALQLLLLLGAQLASKCPAGDLQPSQSSSTSWLQCETCCRDLIRCGLLDTCVSLQLRKLHRQGEGLTH